MTESYNILKFYIVLSPTNALLLRLEKFYLQENTRNYRSYMFRSSTILRKLVQSPAKIIFLLKYSVKLYRCILCGDVAACRETACVLFVVQLLVSEQYIESIMHGATIQVCCV